MYNLEKVGKNHFVKRVNKLISAEKMSLYYFVKLMS